MATRTKEFPEEVMKFFRRMGKQGGKKAAEVMTPEERAERARKAAAASAKVRSEKARQRREREGEE